MHGNFNEFSGNSQERKIGGSFMVKNKKIPEIPAPTPLTKSRKYDIIKKDINYSSCFIEV